MENMNPDCVGLVLKYFVLNPNKRTPYGKASRHALMAYSFEIEQTNPALCEDIRKWLRSIEQKILDEALGEELKKDAEISWKAIEVLAGRIRVLEKPCLLQRIPDTRGGHFETECGYSPEFVTDYCVNCGRKVKRTNMESEASDEQK